MSGYVIAIDRSSPHIIGQRARARRPPTSPTIIGYAQNPVTTVGTLFESVDAHHQQKIKDQSDSNCNTEDDDVRVVRCVTPFLVRQRDTPPSPDPALEPSEVVSGVNEHGNRFRTARYPDRTNSYRYNNRDGTHYEKHRDESAHFYSGRGFTKHYPPPLADKPVGNKRYDRGEVIDPLQDYPVATRKAPAIGQGGIQQPGRSNFSEDGVDKGPKFKRNHKPQQAAGRRASSPPPPAPRGARRSAKHKSKSRDQEPIVEPRAFN